MYAIQKNKKSIHYTREDRWCLPVSFVTAEDGYWMDIDC